MGEPLIADKEKSSPVDPKRSVAGISVRDGKVFIARRIPGGAMGERWEFPGGKVEPNESDEEALVREFQEEFGVPVQVGKHLGSAVFEHKSIPRQLHAYEVIFQSDQFILCEHTDWCWISLDDIEKIDFADSDRKLIPSLREHFPA